MKVHPSRAAVRRARMRAPLSDVLAYLSRKRRNAERMAVRRPEFEDEARWTVRHLNILTSDLRAGLHLGEARVERDRVRHKEA